MVAVYDLGGGTFDAAVLRKTESGFELLGKPGGDRTSGRCGLRRRGRGPCVRALGDVTVRRSAAGRAAPRTGRAATAARLRLDCVQAKENLSYDHETTIVVMLPGVHTEVRLTRAEFEEMISPAVDATVRALGRALQAAGVDAEQVATVLLAGGSSRIPLDLRAHHRAPATPCRGLRAPEALGRVGCRLSGRNRAGVSPSHARPVGSATPVPTPRAGEAPIPQVPPPVPMRRPQATRGLAAADRSPQRQTWVGRRRRRWSSGRRGCRRHAVRTGAAIQRRWGARQCRAPRRAGRWPREPSTFDGPHGRDDPFGRRQRAVAPAVEDSRYDRAEPHLLRSELDLPRRVPEAERQSLRAVSIARSRRLVSATLKASFGDIRGKSVQLATQFGGGRAGLGLRTMGTVHRREGTGFDQCRGQRRASVPSGIRRPAGPGGRRRAGNDHRPGPAGKGRATAAGTGPTEPARLLRSPVVRPAFRRRQCIRRAGRHHGQIVGVVLAHALRRKRLSRPDDLG